MNSPDSEVSTTGKLSLEADLRSTKPSQINSRTVHPSRNNQNFQIIRSLPRGSHEDDGAAASVQGFRKDDDAKIIGHKISGASRENQNFRITVSDQQNSKEIYGKKRDEIFDRSSNEGEGNGQVEVHGRRSIQDFESFINIHQNGGAEGWINDLRRSNEPKDRTDQQTILREQQNSVESPMAAEMLKSSTRRISASKRKKVVVSADAKARWAMLRSLAGTRKEEEYHEDGNEVVPDSVESEQRSLRFEASTKDGSSSIHDQSSLSSTILSPNDEQQSLLRNANSRMDEGRFARSSKVAVESALRRSGSGRRQSSRGDFAESDSSMSRAASVKRYMEKLRSDPNIDETHFVGLRAVPEGHKGVAAFEMSQDSHRKGENPEYSFNGLPRELVQDGRRTEDVDSGEHRLPGKAESHLDGDARRIEGGFDKIRELNHDANRLEGSPNREVHSRGRDLEYDLRDNDASFNREEYALGKDVDKVEGNLHAYRGDVERDLRRLEGDVGRAEHKLEHGPLMIAGALGVRKFEAALGREYDKIDKDARKIEGALSLGTFERALDREEGELRHDFEGALGQELRDLEHDGRAIDGALSFNRLEETLNRKGQEFENDARQFERALAVDKNVLIGLVDQGAHEPKGVMNDLGKPIGRKIEHDGLEMRQELGNLGRPFGKTLGGDGHDIRHALDGLENPLLDHKAQQQPGDGESFKQPENSHGDPHYDAPNHDMIHLQQEPPFKEMLPQQQMPRPRQAPLQNQMATNQQVTHQQGNPHPRAPPQQQGSRKTYVPQHRPELRPQEMPLHRQTPPHQQIPPNQQSRSQQDTSHHQPLPVRQKESNNPPSVSAVDTRPRDSRAQQRQNPLAQAQMQFQNRQQPPIPENRGLESAQQPNQSGGRLQSVNNFSSAQALPRSQPQQHLVPLSAREGLPEPPASPRSWRQQAPHSLAECSNSRPCRSPQIDTGSRQMRQTNFPRAQSMQGETEHKICENLDHHAAGICVEGSQCSQNSAMEDHRAHHISKTKRDPQSPGRPNYGASSVEEDETDATATASMKSMSPRLEPSDQAPSSPSPHTAVFEHLIFGFKQRSEVRIAAAGGNRGFIDQMTELLVKMAEDALPAIRLRLEDNARR